MKKELKPFLKWVGGKRQLVERITNLMPKEYNDYYEPFVGGGALFLTLQNKNTTINDFSSELINTYNCIKENPFKLMELLDEHEERHKISPEEHYYAVRELDRRGDWPNVDVYVKSARMLYLNKACFNGMYRVNKKGFFNVPFNKKKVVKTYDKDNIIAVSEFLSNVTILNQDFEESCKRAKKGDFIFFDPPYDLLKKDSFESYTSEGFGEHGLRRLSDVAHKLREKGCYVMLTNHNTPLVNELFSDFYIDVVPVKRMINSKANRRFGEETIIRSYPVGDEISEKTV